MSVSTVEFVMIGAREAIAAGAGHLEKQVTALESSVSENPALAFDLARTIVESICKTILTDRKILFENDTSLPGLFKLVVQGLPMLPPSASDQAEVRRTLVQTVNGLHTSLQGICELRNACGFASHGSDAERPALDAIHATLAAQTADVIVGFLYRLHRGDRSRASESRDGRSKTVDMVIDANYEPVVIVEQPYPVSEALFGVDLGAYLNFASEVTESRNIADELSTMYPDALRKKIQKIAFVQYDTRVYLKVETDDGELTLEDTAFISDGDSSFFLQANSPDENADSFVTSLDPFSIVNCFDLFTEEASVRVFEAHAAGTLDTLFLPVKPADEAEP